MNRKHCVAIIFICVVLLDNLFLQVKVWAQAPEKPKIAFNRKVNGLRWNIHLMDIDGKNVQLLTKGTVEEGGPTWSPDGKKIAFISLRDPIPKVYVMDADGRNQQRLTRDHVSEGPPAWFDPRFAPAVPPVGKRLLTWGWLKRLGW